MPASFYLAKLLGYRKLQKIPMLFHRGCCWIMGLRIGVSGDLCNTTPTLFVSNHISYLDVFVLGGIVPGSFIAKSEVSKWPVFGSLAKIQNTLFFERHGGKVAGQVVVMQQHFDGNGNLILFPEGTSTPGTHVEPFKSSLFHGAEQTQQRVRIQPLTVAYTHYDGKVMDAEERDCFAWYATMPFVSHLVNVLGLKPVQVELIFHAPVELTDFASRKDCAQFCQQAVTAGLKAANNGINLQEVGGNAEFELQD
ncbi:MAG: lysophospholipid acyltransferase family protein [Pseudomonadales bacterium]